MSPSDIFDPQRWPGISEYDRGQLSFARQKWETIAAWSALKFASATVLDIGCWTGYTTMAAAAAGATATGIDVHAGRLNGAREQARRLGIHCSFEQRSLYRLGVDKRKPVDIVLALGILHNHPRIREALYACAHMASRWLVIECRTDNVQWAQLRVIAPHAEGGSNTHYVFIPSPQWLKAMAFAAGFALVEKALHFSGQRSMFLLRRDTVIDGDKATDLNRPEFRGKLVRLPLDHESIKSTSDVMDGHERYGESGRPSWAAKDIAERFDPAQFVPVIYNPHTRAIGDGQHRITAARRLGHESIVVRVYVGPFSPTIHAGCAAHWGT